MILTKEQAALFIAAAYDARQAGAEAEYEFPNAVATDSGDRITVVETGLQDVPHETYDGPVDMAGAYDVMIVETQLKLPNAWAETWVVDRHITAVEFKALVRNRIATFTVIRP